MESQPMIEPNLAIIIPVYNNLLYTRSCVDSLRKIIEFSQLPPDQVKVIVVDDGSTDGTSAWLEENHPDIVVLNGDGNLWWSGGINTGVKYALEDLNADYVLWWNNDIRAEIDYLKVLLEIIRTQPTNVLIGSKIYAEENGLIWGMGGRFDPEKGTRHMHGERQTDKAAFQYPREVDWFPGMGTTMHRSVYEKIGYLDEINFPQYHGDSDYTHRAKRYGFKLIAFPSLKIYNDTLNTGIKHNDSLRYLFRSLTSIRSNYNLRRDFKFYKIHATSWRAYLFLIKRYARYIGGFIKWKVLGIFGARRTS